MATSHDAGAFARLRAAGFKGAAVRLADIDLPRIGALIGVGEDEIHAIIDVESSGSGFDKLGRPKMLFEPHVFWRHLGPGPRRDRAAALGIAYEKWRPGNYPSDSYPRLAQALDLDVEAALKSASWGLTQILGENCAELGYLTAADMVVAFCNGEAAQLAGTVALIKSKGLSGKLKAHDWAAVARGWNGPGYLELHIEQGPMLERAGLPVGLFTAISGASRLEFTMTGEAGHAGTVAMTEQRDAQGGAAECVLAVEARCRGEGYLVGTVGRIQAHPGAVNTIPGTVRFSIDLRAPEDVQRLAALADIETAAKRIAMRCRLGLGINLLHEAEAVPCDPGLAALVGRAIAAEGHPPLSLPSGAGHDGMAVAAIALIAMVFVRCRGGVSHNPAEFASLPDIEAGARVLLGAIKRFGERHAA